MKRFSCLDLKLKEQKRSRSSKDAGTSSCTVMLVVIYAFGFTVR